jgi:hypothetical protein
VPVAPTVALITQRSLVQIQPPQPNRSRGYSTRCNPVFVTGCGWAPRPSKKDSRGVLTIAPGPKDVRASPPGRTGSRRRSRSTPCPAVGRGLFLDAWRRGILRRLTFTPDGRRLDARRIPFQTAIRSEIAVDRAGHVYVVSDRTVGKSPHAVILQSRLWGSGRWWPASNSMLRNTDQSGLRCNDSQVPVRLRFRRSASGESDRACRVAHHPPGSPRVRRA